jgi:hypothetical protein
MASINNPQQSWGFGGEPPEAVMSQGEVETRRSQLGWLFDHHIAWEG